MVRIFWLVKNRPVEIVHMILLADQQNMRENRSSMKGRGDIYSYELNLKHHFHPILYADESPP